MDAAVLDEWFGGDPSDLEAACSQADLLDACELLDGCPDDYWAPMSAAETLLAVAAMGPCAEALRLIEELDLTDLTCEQHLTVAELLQPMRAVVAGRQLSALVGFAGPTPPVRRDYRDADFAELELSLALGLTQDFAGCLLADARALATSLVRTGDLLRSGRLSEHKATLVADKLGGLDKDTTLAVEAILLPHLVSDSPSQLRRRIRRALLKVQPAPETEQHRDAAGRRHVRIGQADQSEPGLLGLHAALPPETVLAIYARLRQVADGFDQHDGRTQEQRIADAFALLLLGPSADDPAVAQRPRVQVNVTVDLPTLFWLRDHPGELGGYGPIPAQIARELAADADHWQRFVHDPVTGYLLDLGRHRYVPSAELSRFVKARDQFGRFPGSTRRAGRCDADHVRPFDRTGRGNGGSTSASGLASQARTPHRAKTHGGWQLEGDANAELTWITPTGRRHQSRPHDFRADPDDPPAPPRPTNDHRMRPSPSDHSQTPMPPDHSQTPKPPDNSQTPMPPDRSHTPKPPDAPPF